MSAPPVYAAVALPIAVDRSFDYAVPSSLVPRLRIGARMRVPFRSRSMIGYCVAVLDEPRHPDVKEAIEILDAPPLLTGELLRLARWIADRTACSWGEALEAALPAGVRAGVERRKVTVLEATMSAKEAERHAEAIQKRAPKRAKLLRILAEAEVPMPIGELAARAGCNTSAARDLVKRKLARATEENAESIFPGSEPTGEPETPPEPNPDQRKAIETLREMIRASEHRVFVLEGVTGSGKTEIYLRAIEEATRDGSQAIVLVPEISLTPQSVRRFRRRFCEVAVLHSRLTQGERYDQWRKVRDGTARVVIGARSAVFAPVRKLGLIVLDEEHETTFKQENKPRYHARDVALQRAKEAGVPLVLGSATPALETLYTVRERRWAHLVLPERVGGRPLPPVEVIDMSHEGPAHKPMPIFSRKLLAALEVSMDRGEQAILFLNRRGFSTTLCCRRCGHVLRCGRCDIALTYHRERGLARCHYCLWSEPPPEGCPACHVGALRNLGIGTERVEDAVRKLFPGVPIARMDQDTTRARAAHEKYLEAFRKGETRILVGTQMIAKGLDFPNVTCVGVISADTALAIPDFRAAERTFQLLAQVAGRTGRGEKGGKVFVQTLQPEHPAIRAAARHDLHAFAGPELDQRKAFRYPPYSRLVRVLLRGRREEAVAERAESVRKKIDRALAKQRLDETVEVLGPAPCPLSRIEGNYRRHLLLKFPVDADPGPLMARMNLDRGDARSVRVDADIDPVAML